MSLFAFALAAALSQAAPDPAADNEQDLRCIALIAQIIPQAEGEGKSGLVGGLMYFLGRIEGRVPSYKFEDNLTRLLKQTTDFTADRDRCAGILTEKGNQLSAIGNRATARGN